MKYFKGFPILLIVVFCLSSCNRNKMTEPEQVGKKVFKIIKSLSTTSKQNYLKNFLSIEEIRKLAKNENVIKDERVRNEMTSTPKDKWENEIYEDFNEIKQDGIDYEINWKNIEFLDFIYKIDQENGVRISKGTLYFKHLDITYQIRISAIWDGKQYRIFEIENLHKR